MFGPRIPLQAVDQRLGSDSTMRCRLPQVQRYVPEGIKGGGDTVAGLAHHIALQHAGEDLVDDAVALSIAMGAARAAGIGAAAGAGAVALVLVLGLRLDAVTMQHVQSGNKELMGILLLIPGQVLRMVPD